MKQLSRAGARAAIVAIACLWAIAIGTAHAHDRPYDPAHPHPLAYGPRDAPRWLAPILARLRPANGEAARIREHIRHSPLWSRRYGPISGTA